jgi:ABC-type multidrug transport system fused ATPase/permease subunit
MDSTPVSMLAMVALVAATAALWARRAVLARPHPPRYGAPGSNRLGSALAVERRLLGLLRPHTPVVAAGLAATLAATLVGLAQPWPTKILVDDVLGSQRLFGLSRSAALVLTVLLTMALFVLSGALGLLQTKLMFGLSQRLIRDLRAGLFGHMTRLSLRFHDERGTGDAVYRVTTDTYAVQSVLHEGLAPFCAAVFALVGTMAVMVRLDPVFALLSLVSVPGAALTARRFRSKINSASLALHERESDVYAHAEQAFVGIRTVQAFGREGHEVKRFLARAEASRRAMMRLVTDQTLFGLAVDFVLALGLALVTWVAARRALSGQLTAGEVLVLIAYAGAIYGPVSSLTSLIADLASAAAGAQRVFEVLDQPQVAERPGARAPARLARGELRFDEVTFGYSEDHSVLHGVTFDAGPEELVALVGPTGAGKSTIVSLLLRLYDTDRGRILLDGVDVRDLPLAWLRDQISLVPQDPVLFPASVRENIRYGRLDATDRAVEHAARLANIYDELVADPRGLDAPVGDRGVTLSGGQRQRVAIARAFVRDAPIVVLDEPTSALDAATEALVLEALDRLMVGRTGLVIAHRLATVHRAQQVLVVEGGRIVERGSHSRLVRRQGLYRELHEARFGQERRAEPVVVDFESRRADGQRADDRRPRSNGQRDVTDGVRA